MIVKKLSMRKATKIEKTKEAVQRCLLRLLTLAFALFVLSAGALAQETRVGDTNDACDASNIVRLQSKDGQVSVKAGMTKRVKLPSLTTEVNWLCGGDQERSANDQQFDIVRITRANNGAISWVFFKSSPPSGTPGGPNLVRVGDTRDACDASRHVTFNAADGEAKITAGDSKLVQLASARNSLSWSCVTPAGDCPNDVCDEHVSNDISFDTVQVERAGNGAIRWVFYRKKNSAPEGGAPMPAFVRNATGNLRVAVSAGALKKEFPVTPGLLKKTLDGEWTKRRSDITKLVQAQLNDQGQEAASKLSAKFHIESLSVATINTTELRTAADKETLSLKYIAHGNTARTRFSISGIIDPEVVITFDIELELSMKLDSLTKPPQTSSAGMRLAHTEIEGANDTGNIAQELFKSKLRDAKTRANNVTSDLSEEVNKALADNFPTAPKNFPVSVVKTDITITPAGTVRICLHTAGAAPCQFAGSQETAHVPRVLDTDVDRCGRSQIWLRDSAKQRFVSIGKGKNAIVEVESREFPWFCGGDLGPETNESATGPVGTYLLRVSRAATGDRIDWGFLSWR